jgi:putative endonuclease
MFTVYVLYSQTFRKIYVGYTSNLEQRLHSHNYLSNKGYTVKYRPWLVLYQEIFNTKAEAMVREKQLKSAQGRAFIWGLVDQKFPG